MEEMGPKNPFIGSGTMACMDVISRKLEKRMNKKKSQDEGGFSLCIKAACILLSNAIVKVYHHMLKFIAKE
jgi:hypothetical protein